MLSEWREGMVGGAMENVKKINANDVFNLF